MNNIYDFTSNSHPLTQGKNLRTSLKGTSIEINIRFSTCRTLKNFDLGTACSLTLISRDYRIQDFANQLL
ncbi:unnamed protein product [Schistosoma turkestanicum]|nr:unnamed protein product [Schistosoma turkestanicum]